MGEWNGTGHCAFFLPARLGCFAFLMYRACLASVRVYVGTRKNFFFFSFLPSVLTHRRVRRYKRSFFRFQLLAQQRRWRPQHRRGLYDDDSSLIFSFLSPFYFCGSSLGRWVLCTSFFRLRKCLGTWLPVLASARERETDREGGRERGREEGGRGGGNGGAEGLERIEAREQKETRLGGWMEGWVCPHFFCLGL